MRNFTTVAAFGIITALAPISAHAMDVGSAQGLAADTASQIQGCKSGACVMKVLNSAKSKMNGMPVLQTTSSGLSKVSRMIKKSCSAGCDAATVTAIQAEVAAQAKKVSKSRNAQDKAFAVVFQPSMFGAKQLSK